MSEPRQGPDPWTRRAVDHCAVPRRLVPWSWEGFGHESSRSFVAGGLERWRRGRSQLVGAACVGPGGRPVRGIRGTCRCPLFDDHSEHSSSCPPVGGDVIDWSDQPADVPPPAQSVVGNLLRWESVDSRLTPADNFFTVKHYNGQRWTRRPGGWHRGPRPPPNNAVAGRSAVTASPSGGVHARVLR